MWNVDASRDAESVTLVGDSSLPLVSPRSHIDHRTDIMSRTCPTVRTTPEPL